MIAALAGKPTEHLAQKMEKLGVYDLQTLKVAIAVLGSEAFGKSRVLDVQGVVILIFGPHFRYFFAFLGNLAQKVVGPGNWRFNSEAQHVAGGGDGARLGAKLQSFHEPHHIRSLGGEAGAQSRGRARSVEVRANGA